MTILLTAIAILLLAISVWQISKIFEVSNLGVKRDESQIASDKDNDMQGKLMFLFLAFIYVVTIYSFASYTKVLLPESASEHGYTYDTLLWISFALILFVQTVTQALLHYFAYKYRGINGRKASFITHNNKLEFIWTIIPAIVLFILIFYGMNTWSDIMNFDEDEDAFWFDDAQRDFDHDPHHHEHDSDHVRDDEPDYDSDDNHSDPLDDDAADDIEPPELDDGFEYEDDHQLEFDELPFPEEDYRSEI